MPFPKMSTNDLAKTLKSLGIDVLIVGAIKKDTEKQLHSAGIEVVSGCEGSPADAVSEYVTEKLWGTDDIPKKIHPQP